MAFPSVLVFKEIPDFVDYEISSKYVADIVKGTVEIQKWYITGINQLPHFENLLHTFAMQYKIKVQGNIETVCLLSKKPWFSAVCGIIKRD